MITGGRVSFTRTVRPADFESKSATVELTFDDVTDLPSASLLAQTKALGMLGLKASTAEAVGATVTVEVGTSAADTAKAEYAAKEAAKAAAAAAKAAEKAAKEAAKNKTPPKGSVPNTSTADPAAIEDDPTTTGTVATGGAADPAAITDDDSLFGGVEDTITDARLMEEITKQNGKVKNPIAIRQLIGKYVAPPKRANEIPADKRNAFLIELAAIKPLV